MKMFFKIISVRKAVSKKEIENKKINFLSLIFNPGFFFSSKIITKAITRIQMKIEEPFKEKNEKK